MHHPALCAEHFQCQYGRHHRRSLLHTHTGKEKASADGERPKTFREREKRKRELGQQARDGSYVEEEKRILRESVSSSFGQGFD